MLVEMLGIQLLYIQVACMSAVSKDKLLEFNLLNKLGAVFLWCRNEWGTSGKTQYCLLFPHWTRSIREGHGLAIKPDTKD